MEELKLIRIIKPPDPTKDGPPLVTKEMIAKVRKEMRIMQLSKKRK